MSNEEKNEGGAAAEDDPLRPHSHDNNPQPPHNDPTITLHGPAGQTTIITLPALLSAYPPAVIPAYRYTTDHGQHGPYRLEGVRLLDLVEQEIGRDVAWREVAVVSADGFGNRLTRAELMAADEPVLLCTRADGRPLSRRHGLVRLVVPSERDNALRQIKWVEVITVVDVPNRA